MASGDSPGAITSSSAASAALALNKISALAGHVPGYIGDGRNAWSAVHRCATARLIRLGIESAPAGTRLRAVAEEFIPTASLQKPSARHWRSR